MWSNQAKTAHQAHLSKAMRRWQLGLDPSRPPHLMAAAAPSTEPWPGRPCAGVSHGQVRPRLDGARPWRGRSQGEARAATATTRVGGRAATACDAGAAARRLWARSPGHGSGEATARRRGSDR
jgi:hypothetical protein